MDTWAMTGLLHDSDWEIAPLEDHPHFSASILRERCYPEDAIREVLSHGSHTGLSRDTLMEKTLFAVDELTGFITAVALARPTKSLDNTEVRAVRKKMNDKAFALSVSREDIAQDAEAIGLDLDAAHSLRHRRTEADCR